MNIYIFHYFHEEEQNISWYIDSLETIREDGC